jgi:hypothetical protein
VHGSGDDPLIARVAAELRRPAAPRPGFEARVMAAVRRAPPALPARAWTWLREPRRFAVSPLGGLAMAAGLAGLVIVGTWGAVRASRTGDTDRATATRAGEASAASLVTFVFVAPEARTVSLAGDFDGWDRARMQMRREASGLWTLEVPLAPGRYQYAFVVDGRRFVADPAAPRAVGDDFGQPSSVVTVGGALRATGGSL